MTKIKYVVKNAVNNEPLYESESYIFLSTFVKKLEKKAGKPIPIKIYKKIITEKFEEIH